MINPSLISFVARSKRRKEVLNLLTKEEKSQVELMNSTKMYKAHTSRAIKELLKKNLIKCSNPKDRSFKFYKITSLGVEILKESEKLVLTN